MEIQDSKEELLPVSSWKFWTQRKYVLVLFVFFGYFNVYSLQANMSIAVVAMTQVRHVTLENGSQIDIAPEFKWDNRLQGYLLSSFFYGYVSTQLLGGVLARKWGAKYIYGGGLASTAFITVISPWLAEADFFALLAARILIGVFEGVTYSSLYTMWSSWIPPSERSRTTTRAVSGSFVGTVFSMWFFSYLAEVTNWRSIFWFSGSIGLLWFLAWAYFISEFPERDKNISQSELKYIQSSLQECKLLRTHKVQWKSLLTSKATWALNLVLCCETWGFHTLLTLLPKYFKDVFHFDISKSGGLSALPYVVLAIMMQGVGHLADLIIMKKWLTITQTRKCFVIIGFLSQASFLMGACFWGQVAGTVFCLAMAVGLGSLAIATIMVNALDIAPLHSGVIFGVANTLGTVPGIVSPIIAGYIISTENPTVAQWRIVFYITASLYLFGAVFYTIFGTGTRQSWDVGAENIKPDDNDKSESISKY